MSVRGSIADYTELYLKERIDRPSRKQLQIALHWFAYKVNEEATKVFLQHVLESDYPLRKLQRWSNAVEDIKHSMSQEHDQDYEARMEKILPLLNEHQKEIGTCIKSKIDRSSTNFSRTRVIFPPDYDLA